MAKNIGLEENQSESNRFALDTDEGVDEYFKNIMPVLAAAVKASNGLPSGEKYDFYTTYKEFLDLMQVESSNALEILGHLLRQNGIRAGGIQAPGADADDRFEALIDANDQLAERISTRLDEASGIRKAAEVELVVASNDLPDNKTPKTATTASWNLKKDDKEKMTPTSYRLLAARFIQRPQAQFKEPVDNSDKSFYPKLQDKPNALIPLSQSLVIQHSEDGTIQPSPNPYRHELDRLEYTKEQLDAVPDPVKPKPINESGSMTYIETPEGLDKLVEDLLGVKELAVDLEAHSYRTFQGLTCLMQISTRTQDYVIDTLALREEMQALNLIFTNPNIVKVFHGADWDIEWLQRDFSLYVVNMFDTYQASKVLNFHKHSLAFLLKYYCQVDADKQYQLADWRIRPLPQELLNYAREDTHYLLYIYDMMKNELITRGNEQKNLLRNALDKSKITCSKVYAKPALTEEAIHAMYTRSRKSFNNRQMYALRKLYEWRFRMAQSEDESMGYILPNHILMQICEVLPRESSGVLACCTPIPPLVRQHLHTIHSLIREAREQPLTTPQSIRMEARHQAEVTKTLLNCPHDTPAEDEDEETVKYSDPSFTPGVVKAKLEAAFSFMFQSTASKLIEKVKSIKESFLTPLTNYNPVKFIDYSAQYQQRLDQIAETGISVDSTLDESALADDSQLEPTPAKRQKITEGETESPATVEEDGAAGSAVVEPGKEDGEIEEVDETVDEHETKKQKRKRNAKSRAKAKKDAQMLPLRMRPASNPEKKMVAPSKDFKPYNYSTADYSEFQTPELPKQNFRKGDKKKQKSQKWRPQNEKSFTYKQSKY